MSAKTLFEKIWNHHLVEPATEQAPALLYIDLHLIHELTSPQGFDMLRERELTVRCPERTLGTVDHGISTHPNRGALGSYGNAAGNSGSDHRAGR